MKSTFAALTSAALVFAFSACTAQYAIPPAQMPDSTPVEVLSVGDTALEAQAAGGGELLGASVIAGGLGVETQLAPSLRLGGRGYIGRAWDPDGDVDVVGSSISGGFRGGLRFTPPAVDRFMQLGVGMGYGRNVGGSWLAPDVMLGLGFRNRHAIPTSNISVSYQVPLTTRDITMRDDDLEDGVSVGQAQPGLAVQLFNGVAVPFGEDEEGENPAATLSAGFFTSFLWPEDLGPEDNTRSEAAVYWGPMVSLRFYVRRAAEGDAKDPSTAL